MSAQELYIAFVKLRLSNHLLNQVIKRCNTLKSQLEFGSKGINLGTGCVSSICVEHIGFPVDTIDLLVGRFVDTICSSIILFGDMFESQQPACRIACVEICNVVLNVIDLKLDLPSYRTKTERTAASAVVTASWEMYSGHKMWRSAIPK